MLAAMTTTPQRGEESKHFTSLQIFKTYAEPSLDEYIDQDEQVLGTILYYGQRCITSSP